MNKDKLATLGGLLVSLGLCSTINWETFSYTNPAHVSHLFFSLCAGLGGFLSKFKGKDGNE